MLQSRETLRLIVGCRATCNGQHVLCPLSSGRPRRKLQERVPERAAVSQFDGWRGRLHPDLSAHGSRIRWTSLRLTSWASTLTIFWVRAAYSHKATNVEPHLQRAQQLIDARRIVDWTKNTSTNASSRSSAGGLTVPIERLTKGAPEGNYRLVNKTLQSSFLRNQIEEERGKKNGLQVHSRVESLVGTFIISPVGTRWSRQSTTCSLSWKSSFIGRGIPRFYSNFTCPFNSATFFWADMKGSCLSLSSPYHTHSHDLLFTANNFSTARRHCSARSLKLLVKWNYRLVQSLHGRQKF